MIYLLHEIKDQKYKKNLYFSFPFSTFANQTKRKSMVLKKQTNKRKKKYFFPFLFHSLLIFKTFVREIFSFPIVYFPLFSIFKQYKAFSYHFLYHFLPFILLSLQTTTKDSIIFSKNKKEKKR